MAGVTYDPEADVLYVRLLDETVDHQAFVDDFRIIDYTADNAVVGIEFIAASDGVDLTDLPYAHTVEELIGQSGQAFRIFA